jgi:gliding motility-associated-like protein
LIQYFYKLVALNNCDTPKIESNIESSIHLTVAQSTTTNDLSWNPYEQFAGKFKQYNIHRKRVGKGDIKLTSTSGLLYQDDLSTLEGKSISEEICYYVEAIEDSTTNPNSQIAGNAKSNISCVIVGTVIDIPKYFYNDGKHPPFRPKSSFLPVKYQFVIFDRWGTKIYETTDFASLGWNGRYSGGGAAPQSAYLYYVKMVGSDGKSLEQKGTFTLILP